MGQATSTYPVGDEGVAATCMMALDYNIAAIDFGTTFCSLAFKVEGSDVIKCLKIDGTFDRVPTAILIEKDQHGGLNVAETRIGFLAQMMYENIPQRLFNDYLYFECFKMQLRDDEKLSREMVISAFAGANYYIIEVIALILQHLRTIFEKHLSMLPHQIRDGSTLRKLKATDFHWVLTVEIWKDRGKQIMREAAYRGGLLCDVPPIERFTAPPTRLSEPNIPYAAKEKLVLALEPECAALYCQQLTSDMMAAYCDQSATINSKRYMVLDIRGDTVNISIHGMLEADKTIILPTISDLGGKKVNNEFSILLQKITGDEGFKQFYSVPGKEASHKDIIYNLVFQDFEHPKKHFGQRSYDDAGAVHIRVDPRLVKFYGQKLEESSNKYGVEFDDDDMISIAFSKMKELFQPAIDGIVSCMMSAIEKSPVTIDTIYLIGEFGNYPYVYTKVKETLGRRNISVVVPTNHNVVVVQGAIIFRQKMSIFNSRVSDAYYGVRITEKYDERKHPLERRVYNNTDKCYEVKNYFNPFVCKGQSVKFGEKFEKTLYPWISTQTSITLAIYRTTKDGVMFVKDLHGNPIPGIEELGELNLPIPINGLNISQRKIKLELMLGHGGTELHVRAVYGPTGVEVNATLDFLKHNTQRLEETTKPDKERRKSDGLTRELDEEKGRLGGLLRTSELDGLRKEMDEERRKLDGVKIELDDERRELGGIRKELDKERRKSNGLLRELGEERRRLGGILRELDGVKKELDGERRKSNRLTMELDEERRRLGEELDSARKANDNLTKIIKSHQEEARWKVGRQEIDITSQELGKGAWGAVNVAYFRGTPVAAKCLHDVIISDYIKSIFIREMNLAAKLRHPNLTLFVGATLVNNPIILSELMPTSLRKELERSRLTQPQIIKISSDVCCGLSYLHLFQPSPIVHRDVSNANVLLEPSGGAGQWKAKVSDYGSANLIHNISPNSVMPGCISYAAPEARFPDDHSPAMDVYSFGVLLMEMILHTPPSPTVAGRESQSKTIELESMKLLVQPCLMNDRHKRPLIGHVLKELRKQ